MRILLFEERNTKKKGPVGGDVKYYTSAKW